MMLIWHLQVKYKFTCVKKAYLCCNTDLTLWISRPKLEEFRSPGCQIQNRYFYQFKSLLYINIHMHVKALLPIYILIIFCKIVPHVHMGILTGVYKFVADKR